MDTIERVRELLRQKELGNRTEPHRLLISQHAAVLQDIDNELANLAPALLRMIDAQQAVVAAARAVVGDVTADNWYEDGFTYFVDAEALETLKREYDALAGMKGEGDGTR